MVRGTPSTKNDEELVVECLRSVDWMQIADRVLIFSHLDMFNIAIWLMALSIFRRNVDNYDHDPHHCFPKDKPTRLLRDPICCRRCEFISAGRC